ncbi:hypothetical protein [Streptomyces sp. NPDC088789]
MSRAVAAKAVDQVNAVTVAWVRARSASLVSGMYDEGSPLRAARR